mgnify:CR=1 FL=1|jgi:hypothetical protein
MQLFHRFIQSGSPVDIIVVTRRPEISAMMASEESPLPKRHTLTVQRPFGRRVLPIQRELRALRRLRAVTSLLKRRNLTGKPIEKIVVKGAALELRAAKKAKIPRRIYLTDTEVNHLAHRIALSAATEVIVTPNWRQDLDGGFIDACKEQGIKIHNLTGELPHAYLSQPVSNREAKQEGVPTIIHRALVGGGVHDKDEMVAAASLIPDLGMRVTTVAENHPINSPWGLPMAISEYDGVLSESVTLALESVLSGVPTLLVSKAQRGFLDPHLGGGLLFRIESTIKGPALNNEVAAWREAVQMRRRGDGLATGWSDCYNELKQILR